MVLHLLIWQISYLSTLLGALRSANQLLLTQPTARLKSYGERAFSVTAPRYWNDLPLFIKECSDLKVFKSFIKAYLFKKFTDAPEQYIK